MSYCAQPIGRRTGPAHIHFLVSAPGYETLVTQVFVKGDKQIEDDAVFTANEKMIGEFKKAGDDFSLSYDFPLRRGESGSLAPAPDENQRCVGIATDLVTHCLQSAGSPMM